MCELVTGSGQPTALDRGGRQVSSLPPPRSLSPRSAEHPPTALRAWGGDPRATQEGAAGSYGLSEPGGPGRRADTHTNWMTLSKPSISKRLSVSEAPSSRDSFPGDERGTAGRALDRRPLRRQAPGGPGPPCSPRTGSQHLRRSPGHTRPPPRAAAPGKAAALRGPRVRICLTQSCARQAWGRAAVGVLATKGPNLLASPRRP